MSGVGPAPSRIDRRTALAALAGAGALAAGPRWVGAAEGGAAALAAAARRAGLTGSLGVAAVDVVTGAPLDGLASDLPLAPASVAKVATAIFALHALGAGHRFVTEVAALGAVAAGRLQGDLVLRGGGDPTLDSDGLAALAAQAHASVGAVAGAFRVDPGPGPEIAEIDPGMREAAAYNPAVGPLNLNFNRVLLEWRRDASGLETRLAAHAAGWSPDAPTVALDVAPADCRCPDFAHSVRRGGEAWRVRGAALAGEGSVWLPVRAPSVYAAGVFRAAAAARGLALPPAVLGPAPGGAAIARLESPRLVEMVADMLRFSTNLTAEAVGLAASRAVGAAPADLAASGGAMTDWIGGFLGAPTGDPGLRLVNHSGLSADSRASAMALARLMRAALRRPPPGAALPDLLRPHAIDERGAPAPEGTQVRAKTGTLDFARALAGYLTTPRGRVIAFAYLANDLGRRRPGEDRPAGAIPWRNRAVSLERALLRDWAARFDA